MKKILALLLTTLLASGTYAQMNKSTWLISGATSFNMNSHTSTYNTTQSLIVDGNAKVGFLVLKNFAVGINYSLLNNYWSGGNVRTVSLGGIFTRYYLPKNFFAGIGINAMTQHWNTNRVNSGPAFPLELGLAAFVSRNIAIEPSLYYVKGDHTGSGTNSALTYGYSTMLGLNLGITLYFNRK